MNAPTKLAAYTITLVAAFGASLGIGSAVGPVGPVGPDTTSHDTVPHDGGSPPARPDGHRAPATGSGDAHG